jgi:hypothetical protein
MTKDEVLREAKPSEVAPGSREGFAGKIEIEGKTI